MARLVVWYRMRPTGAGPLTHTRAGGPRHSEGLSSRCVVAARQGEKRGAIAGRTEMCMGVASQGLTRGVGCGHMCLAKLGLKLVSLVSLKSCRLPRRVDGAAGSGKQAQLQAGLEESCHGAHLELDKKMAEAAGACHAGWLASCAGKGLARLHGVQLWR